MTGSAPPSQYNTVANLSAISALHTSDAPKTGRRHPSTGQGKLSSTNFLHRVPAPVPAASLNSRPARTSGTLGWKVHDCNNFGY